MELSRLSALLKRIGDWENFLSKEKVSSDLRLATESRIANLKRFVKSAWEVGSVSAAEESAMLDLERQLEQLNEEARLVSGRHIAQLTTRE